ncbi:MAG TPA: helix-turn-helix domain-containing protein, partial [Mycobacteriales bacterium]
MSRRAESIGAVAALSDTLRRRLYDFIRAQARPVSRDEAAEYVGISRRLAAFHLDKLTRSGLLRSHYGRPEGAPKSPGRAPKLYQPTDSEFEVAIPARQYDLIGQILIDAVSAVDGTDGANPVSGPVAGADTADQTDVSLAKPTEGRPTGDPDAPGGPD